MHVQRRGSNTLMTQLYQYRFITVCSAASKVSGIKKREFAPPFRQNGEYALNTALKDN